MTQAKDIPNWRKTVKCSDALPDHCQTFLDEHAAKFKITTGGLVHLTEPIGVIIPYEICPLRVKKIIRTITPDGQLTRSLFKTKASYQSALCNLHVYGYLQNIDQTLIERRRVRAVARKRWSDENPEAIKRYAAYGRKFCDANKIKMLRV
jgi:hypothetical protein